MSSAIQKLAFVIASSVAVVGTANASDGDIGPFCGTWAFELSDGYPVWLSVGIVDSQPSVDLLWAVGSARPANNIIVGTDQLSFSRKLTWKPGGEDGASRTVDEPFVLRRDGESVLLSATSTKADGTKERVALRGKLMPPMPPKPDLDGVKYHSPITLFNGNDLGGWRLTNPAKKNGWRVENGVLVNETPKTDFGAYGQYGNLRTDESFSDFRLTLEYNVPKGGNSGVYLRGMYEAQVVDRDSKMQGIQGPGAIFGRIEPVANAGNPGGEWNRYVLTLVDRHVTVELNGQRVIDNQPVHGCTGGGISADDTRPGPIMLQGDHTTVRYRNIVIEPVER